jgi:aerobic carbon-monoxide dehydrogenase medium subunit
LKPSRFSYHAPERVDEAVGLLAEHGGDAKVLAGGQSLVPMMSFRLATVEHLIDINTVAGLDTIERVNGTLRIGALVRQSVAEHDATVAGSASLLAKALPHIGHFQIRNRGTIGGSIAHADPASELPAVALALDATMEIDGPSRHREVPASGFFESTWTTALGEDELLTAVRFPVWSGKVGFAVEEIARRHGDFALVGAVVGVELDGDSVVRAAIGLFGVGNTPIRAAAAEQALVAAGANADLASIGAEAANGLNPAADLHASADYRKRVAAVVVRRALQKAITEARS